MANGLITYSNDGTLLIADDLVGLSLQETVILDNVDVEVTPSSVTTFGNGSPLSSTLAPEDIRQGWLNNPVLSSDTEFLATGIAKSGDTYISLSIGAGTFDPIVKELNVGILEMYIESSQPFGPNAFLEVLVVALNTATMTRTEYIRDSFGGFTGTSFLVSKQYSLPEYPLTSSYVSVYGSADNGGTCNLRFGLNTELSASLISGLPITASIGVGSVLKYVYVPGVLSDPPVIFIEPTDSNLYYAEVVRYFNSTNNEWVIGIMQSGTIMQPSKVHIYGKDKDTSALTTGVGLQLKNEDGVITFDSRLNPLQVVGTATSASPLYPPSSGNPTTVPRVYDFGEGRDPFPALDHSFVVGVPNSIPVVLPSRPIMFSIPSLATASYTRYHTYKWYDTEGWLFTWRQKHEYYKAWSAFYRQGFRVNNGAVEFGWITHALSFKERRKYAASGDPFSDDSVDATTGILPYYDATTNNSPATVIVAIAPS